MPKKEINKPESSAQNSAQKPEFIEVSRLDFELFTRKANFYDLLRTREFIESEMSKVNQEITQLETKNKGEK